MIANRSALLRRAGKGFSLVEILIVVVILGILAAIVIPQFSNAGEVAKVNALMSDISSIRKQLQLYAIDHNGSYPTLDQMWDNLLIQTNASGGTGTEYGPYLRNEPVNPFTNTSTIADDNSGAWEYNQANGALRAVIPENFITEYNLSNTDVVALQ